MNDEVLMRLAKRVSKLETAVTILCIAVGAMAAYILKQIF